MISGTKRGSALRTITIVAAIVGARIALGADGTATADAPTLPDAAADSADTIYFGGDVVTVNDAQPSVEAVAVKSGRILAVGTRIAVEKAHKGIGTKVVDLVGRTLVPGFIDPHSHFMNSLAMKDMANVSSPPVGPATNPEEIAVELRKFADAKGTRPGELVIGYGYDENQMAEGRALTRDDLDKVFPDNPVLVLHVSLHGAVLNSAAMAKFGITAATPTPSGGVIVRKAGSQEPAGLVMETAFLPIFAQLPTPTPEQEIEQLKFGQRMYAAAGVTTAHEGATHAHQVELLKRGAGQGALFIDVIAYPFITDLDKVLAANPAASFGRYRNRLKLGGCKITMDGSPQGRTAYFTAPYLTGGPGGENDWRGEPTFPQDTFNRMLKKCYDLGLQVMLHANGDAAIDMILAGHAFAAAGSMDKDRRSTVIHSQFVRRDQLQKYVDYRLIPSFYTEHAYFFSDAHIRNRGREQAYFLSPMKSAITSGLRPTNHTDFNVLPIDHMMVIWSAVNRTSRSGEVIGPDERVSPLEALKAITINAAYQDFEEATKGSIEPGKLADLVILDGNPLTVKPDAIKDIKVLETIKEGKTIYQR
jgi:predicted amidohydrolase YtcJ